MPALLTTRNQAPPGRKTEASPSNRGDASRQSLNLIGHQRAATRSAREPNRTCVRLAAPRRDRVSAGPGACDGCFRVVRVVAACGGDVACAGQSQDCDREIVKTWHNVRHRDGAGLRTVFVEGEITHPMQRVLNCPMSLDPGSQ